MRPFSDSEMSAIKKKLVESARLATGTQQMKSITVKQLANAAGTSTFIFYRLYNPKEIIFIDVLLDHYERIYQHTLKAYKKNPELPQANRLINAFTAFADYSEKHRLEELRQEFNALSKELLHEHYVVYDRKRFGMIEKALVDFEIGNANATMLEAYLIIAQNIKRNLAVSINKDDILKTSAGLFTMLSNSLIAGAYE